MTKAAALDDSFPSAPQGVQWWRRATVPSARNMPVPREALLDRLWLRYAIDVPHAETFATLHSRANQGASFTNDHIALRSVAGPTGISAIEPIFTRRGWKLAGAYEFADTHLRAVHLSRPGFPRIFISELDATKLPARARQALERLPTNPPPLDDGDDAIANWFCAPAPPRADDLAALDGVSQYGAWLLAFHRRVNHFTASVDNIEQWQTRMLAAGVPMKKDIEGARGSKLRQSATEAAPIDVVLADGSTRSLPYAYFELAQRDAGFDGFLAPQARNLFDMTGGADVVKSSERKFPRKPALLHVELAYGGYRVPVMTENISLGGVYLHLPQDVAFEANAILQLRIELPNAWVDVVGTIVYRTARGAGVEFAWDDDDVGRETLRAFLQ